MIRKLVSTLLLLIAIFVVYTLHKAGTFKTIVPHSQLKNISIYTSIAGTEDLEIDNESGLLFISSSDRWNSGEAGSSQDGIYTLNTKDKNAVPIKLQTTLQGEFHPHGIHLFKENENRYLFAVNHNQSGDFVEVFQFENNQLRHIKSYKNEQMCCPNDVVAVGMDQFYVTNDHGAAEGIARTIEEYLLLANSYLLYFDGEKFTKVLEGIRYANGVNISSDGKTLYVTEASGGKIFVMNRDIESGELSFRFSKDLKTGADNISIDSNGDLWIGAHPKLLAFVEHEKNRGAFSPSQVLKLSHKGENDFEVIEYYLDAGEQLSGSSVALHFDNEVFIGVVFDSKLLRGTIDLVE